MKKHSFLLSAIFASLLLFILSTCNNFADASNLLEEIDTTITYANAPAFSVRIAPLVPEHGNVLSGISKDNVKVTDTFAVEFQPTSEYIFVGWKAYNKNDLEISYDDYVSFGDSSKLVTSVQITGGNDEIYAGNLLIVPVCRSYEKGYLVFDNDYGITNYSNNEFKEGTDLALRFTLTKSSYTFAYWQVRVGDEIDNSGNYVSLENARNPESAARFIKKPEDGRNIYIYPVCYEKPTVLLKSPQPSGNEGAYRDSRIKVVFDTKMDVSSIYYDEIELATIGADSLLTADVKQNDGSIVKKTYGYVKNGNIYFKNIDIKDRNSGKSILRYFAPPYFASDDMLVVPPSADENGRFIPVGTELLVTLSENFCYKTSEGYSISTGEKTSWTYYVNDRTDSEAPDLNFGDSSTIPGISAIASAFYDRDGKPQTVNWNREAEIKSITESGSSLNMNQDKLKYYVRDGKLKLYVTSSDYGSGPNSIKMTLFSYNTYSYEDIQLSARRNGNQLEFFEKDDKNGTISAKEFVLERPDGWYLLYFTADDVNGNEVTSSTYAIFLKSGNPIASKPYSLSTTKNKFEFQTVMPSDAEKLFYQIREVKTPAAEYSDPVEAGTYFEITKDLKASTSYQIKFYATDIYGNRENYVEYIKNTSPNEISFKTVPAFDSATKTIPITWDKPAGNYAGAVLCYSTSELTIEDLDLWNKVVIPVQSDATQTYNLDVTEPGANYKLVLMAYDSGDDFTPASKEGNYSTPSAVEEVATLPSPVTNFTVTPSTTEEGKLIFNWERPAGQVSKYIIYTKKSSEETWPTTGYEIEASEISYELTVTDTGCSTDWQITTYNGLTPSEESPVVTELVIPPKNISITTNKTVCGAESIQLSWDALGASTTIDGIVIKHRIVGTSTYTENYVDKDNTSYTIPSLASGSTYEVEYNTYVGTEDNRVYGIPKYLSSLNTHPKNVTNIEYTTEGTSVTLSWTPAEGNYYGVMIFDAEGNNIGRIQKGTSSFTQNNLENGKSYTYRIKTYTSSGVQSLTTNQIVVNTGVAPVKNPKVTSETTDTINLSWTAPAGAYDKVVISWKTENNDYNSTNKHEITNKATTYTVTGLSTGESYTFKFETIKAVDGKDNVAEVEMTASTKPGVAESVTVVRASAASKQLKVSWSKPSEGKTSGYRIYYNTSNSYSGSTYATDVVATTATSYNTNITVPNYGTTYYIWVVPYLDDVVSSASTTTTAYCTTCVSAVNDLKVTETKNNSIKVTWSAPSNGNPSGYRIYVGNVYKTYTTDSSYTLSGCTAGTSYNIKVVPYDDSNNASNEGATNSVTQYTRPSNASVTITQSTSSPLSYANFDWTGLKANHGIMIFKNTTSSSFDTSSYVDYWNTSHSTKNKDYSCVTSGTTYYWIVTYVGAQPSTTPAACKSALNTTVSSTKTHYAKPGNASSLTVTSKTTTSVTLSWTAPSNSSSTYYSITKRDLTNNNSSATTVANTQSTTYTIPSLTAGNKYEFTVTPYVNSISNSSNTLTVTDVYTKPLLSTLTATVNASNPNNHDLTWTYPVSRSDIWYHIFQNTVNNFDTATNIDYWYSGHGTTSSAYTANTGNLYYYWIVSYAISNNPSSIQKGSDVYSYEYNISDAVGPVVYKPSAASNISVYMDNGQGRIKLKWTNPNSKVLDGVYVRVYRGTILMNNYKFTGTPNENKEAFIDISSFSRQNNYTIKVVPYIGNVEGTENSISYSNSTGNMKIKGITYSYTALRNVITSSTTIKQVSGSSSYTGGAFPNGRSVTLSPYSIGQYEVTNQFYVAVMGGIAPSENGRDSYMPAEKFNFYRAAVFCNKLSALFGYTPFYNIGGYSSTYDWNNFTSSNVVNIPTSDTTSWTQFTVNTISNGYRLPTEPQWELAARGGVQNGTQWSYKYSGSNTYTDVAWFKANSSGTKKTVGQKTSNRLDLYDMSGNVYEWLTDYNNNPSGSETCTNPIITYTDSRKTETKILYKGAGFATSDTSKWPVDYNSEKTAPWNSAGDVGMRICRNATCTQ